VYSVKIDFMKTTCLLIIGIIVSGQMLIAADPEPILPKTKVIRSIGWYATQQQLWEQKLKNDRGNLDAWMNYYVVSRYLTTDDEQLEKIVLDMEAISGSAFQYNFIKGLQLGYNNAQKPENPSTYSAMILAAEVAGDPLMRREFCLKMYSADQISTSLLHYSYNVLMSTEPGSILITEGENTSIPLYVLQDVFAVRNDVKILQLELLASDDFREQILGHYKLLLNPGDLKKGSNSKQLISVLLPAQNPSYKFFYTLTLSRENVASIREQLYVVGLASAMSKDRIDNLAIIRKNIETRFLLDYISVDFNGESEFASGKVLCANYLVPMLMLHEYYRGQNEIEKANELQALIERIAVQSGKEQLVRNFLEGKGLAIPYFPSQLNFKEIEGTFKKVKDNVYAQEYEVTNAQYNTFLSYLQEHHQEALYQKFAFDLSDYTEPALSFMKTYTANRTATKKDKYFTRYPAVNISYEGAVAYCEWLTDQYNKHTDRKYKKVKFRLPSINEWQIAALGYDKVQSWILDENNVDVGIPKNTTDELTKDSRTVSVKDNDILYPWYRSYNYRNKVLNSRGCALGNFKFSDTQKPCQPSKMITVDGFVMMSVVEAYFANDIGLYDVVGNVAEMTNEKGKACGGSWNHVPEESTIRSINAYEKPDPAVGFRVFMEVLEQ
jgi:formylglycine-generating enzyme required for sulfatase activity